MLQIAARGQSACQARLILSRVHVELGGYFDVDLDQELVELHDAVPPVLGADNGPVGDVQRGEQAGGAVPDLVVGPLPRYARHHPKGRLGTEQGMDLDLVLLVDAEHDR